MDNTQAETLDQVADIVSAYVSNNAIAASDLAGLISSVHSALVGLTNPPEPEPVPLIPAVPVKRSITPDYLVCLEDGKHFRSLKRHLSKLGLTPEEYRAKWGLPDSYPMVAPNYSAARSSMAKAIGLGRKVEPKPERKAPATRKTRAKADA